MTYATQESYPTPNSHISPAEAATELLRRRAAQKSLLAFTEYTKPDFEAAPHHQVIAGALEEFLQDVEQKKSPRLAIYAPPRHTKSELTSRRFPAWVLGKHPKYQMICTSYGAELATDFGREVRDIVGSPEYQKIFKTQLKPDSQASNRWQTKGGGVYVAQGVGGPITGRGAHIGLVDDPVKNQEDADSQTIQEKNWAWYTSTFYSRLMPGGGVVIVCTRWNENDMAGMAVESEDFRVVSLPAISNGKALWPQWYDLGALNKIKAVMPPRQWNALYQQQPTPEEGTYFKRDTFKRFKLGDEPKYLHKYITTDFAVTEKASADYTVFGEWGIDHEGHWWLLSVYRAQSDPSVWTSELVAWIGSVKPLKVFGESGVIRRSVEPFIKREMRDESNYAAFEWLTRTHDKQAMATSARGMAEMGLVHIPLTDWGEQLVTEAVEFPGGKHDDSVDMFALLGMAVDQGFAATLPDPEPEQTEPDDAYATEDDEDNDWMIA